MPIDRLVHLEAGIQETHGLHPQQKEELFRLLSDPKQEIADVSKTHEEHAHSIAHFTDISAHEATRRHRNQDLFRIAMEGLSASVGEFEASPPTLVNTVNKISNLLSKVEDGSWVCLPFLSVTRQDVVTSHADERVSKPKKTGCTACKSCRIRPLRATGQRTLAAQIAPGAAQAAYGTDG